MKTILAILVLCVPVLAQTSLSGGLKVNSLGLGATYKSVVAKFGKPTTEKIQKGDECVPDRRKILTYPGLTFELIEGQKNNFTVITFEVTSAKYDVSGIKVATRRSRSTGVSASGQWKPLSQAKRPGITKCRRTTPAAQISFSVTARSPGYRPGMRCVKGLIM